MSLASKGRNITLLMSSSSPAPVNRPNMRSTTMNAAMSAVSTVEKSRRADEMREAIRVASGDAVRLVRSSDAMVSDEGRLIDEVASAFFSIVSGELRSFADLQERLRRTESELDFASAQVRRRDEFSAKQRTEMLREIQAANEMVRQYVSKYNDLLDGGRTAGSTPAAANTNNASGPSSSLALKGRSSSSTNSKNADSTSNASSTTGEGGPGTAAQIGSEPSTPSHIPLPRLTDPKELEKTLEHKQDLCFADPEESTAEQKLRVEMEHKLKDIQLRLRRENDVIVHRTIKKGEESLKSETTKLESKVRQLEQQLRRKEAEAELQLQKERDRWRLQLQRAADTAKASVLSKLWIVLKDLEVARMEQHDTQAHAMATITALQDKVKDLEQQKSVLVAAAQVAQNNTSTAGVMWMSSDGTNILVTDSQLHSKSPSYTDSAHRTKSSGGIAMSRSASDAAEMMTPSAFAVEPPDDHPMMHTTSSTLQSNGSMTLQASSSKRLKSPDEGETGDLSLVYVKSARRKSGARASVSPNTANIRRGQGQGPRQSFSSTTQPSLRTGAVSEEVMMLKDNIEQLRRNLTIATLARDEALAERDVLAEELYSADPEAGAALLLRIKSARATQDDSKKKAGEDSESSKVDASIGALLRAVDVDLKQLLMEFTQSRQQQLTVIRQGQQQLQKEQQQTSRRNTSSSSSATVMTEGQQGLAHSPAPPPAAPHHTTSSASIRMVPSIVSSERPPSAGRRMSRTQTASSVVFSSPLADASDARHSPFRDVSSWRSSPIEDLGDALTITSMTPQPRPSSAGRLRMSSPRVVSMAPTTNDAATDQQDRAVERQEEAVPSTSDEAV